jgi:hypothetical protein
MRQTFAGMLWSKQYYYYYYYVDRWLEERGDPFKAGRRSAPRDGTGTMCTMRMWSTPGMRLGIWLSTSSP